MLLSTIVPDAIWVSERPVWFSGVRLRARTTIIRLGDGRLLVHSPPLPTPELCESIDDLGEVAFLVVPNCFHHLGTPAFAARYPSAAVVAPPTAAAKSRDLPAHLALTDGGFLSAIPEFDTIQLEGCSFLDETVFFHRPTGSLIGTDIVLSASEKDHFTWRWAARITRCYDRVSPPPDVRAKTPPSDDAARSIDRMTALPIERILVAHADPIVDRPAAQLAAAWEFAGAEPRNQ